MATLLSTLFLYSYFNSNIFSSFVKYLRIHHPGNFTEIIWLHKIPRWRLLTAKKIITYTRIKFRLEVSIKIIAKCNFVVTLSRYYNIFYLPNVRYMYYVCLKTTKSENFWNYALPSVKNPRGEPNCSFKWVYGAILLAKVITVIVRPKSYF